MSDDQEVLIVGAPSEVTEINLSKLLNLSGLLNLQSFKVIKIIKF